VRARIPRVSRRPFSRIWVRLLAFNLLLVFLPAAGFFFLDVYERQLLEEQERSMVQQGRVLAAALAERGALQDVEAQQILDRLELRFTARLRVLDGEGRLLADSSQLGPRSDEIPTEVTEEGARESVLYWLGSGLFRAWDRLVGRPDPLATADEFYDPTRPFGGPEVLSALGGRYGATTRLSPGQRSITLYSAIPIRGEAEVEGVVLVSQSTLRILEHLYDVRLAGFKVFLASLAVASLLSLVVATTIVRPVRRLRRQATELLDRRGRLTGRFESLDRADAIGDLARALAELSRRLEARIGLMESFAADVSHELRNPLASIRAAVEMIEETDDRDQRVRFLRIAQREIARLEGLLSEVREVGLIDVYLDEEETAGVPIGGLLAEIVEGALLRSAPSVDIELEVRDEVTVEASPDRLAQVFENLLDNAVSFSADTGGTVRVAVTHEDGAAVVWVEDEGAGIPPEHLDRVFDRFFSYRPAESGTSRTHSGLGLALVRAVVEGYGGSVEVVNGQESGARFTVRLPT